MKTYNTNKFFLLGVGLLLSSVLTAREWVGTSSRSGSSIATRAAGCAPASQNRTLEFNNASAYIENSGLLWYNRSLSRASYIVPKDAGTSPIYAGGLWMGGVDATNQLKLAAIRFRSDGNDYWPGPLSTTAGSGNGVDKKDFGAADINAAECAAWDKFFVITRQEVETYRSFYICSQDPLCNASDDFPGYAIPSSILDWPAHGDVSKFQDYYIAPFYDNDGDGVYNVANGDYPWYDIEEEIDCRNDRQVTLFGDYTIWWIFNDRGNIHTESGGESIGMEIRGQAFSFATNDEINDMTFYNYEMINRSTQTLFDTYFGQNVDTDLGCAQDDYVGCDVGRGLGYAYNADATDDNCSNGAVPYGANPPAIGVDFFEGPYQDNDGKANPFFVNGSSNFLTEAVPGNGIGYGDSTIDNERFGMRRFVYYNNSASGNQSDPDNQIEHYNYLKGLWKDGVKFQYGGDAYPAPVGSSTSGVDCDFMFPSNPATGVNTDPEGWGTGGNTSVAAAPWSETSVGNAPGDRRFLQSAGPFTLEPGALNNITVGVVYGRGTSGNLSSIAKLTAADDKAQSLFDNCFEILEGPDAPKLVIQELDKELILTIDPTANGADIENYSKLDPTIDTSLLDPSLKAINGKNNYYTFEGYQIYQLKDISVSASDIYDIDKSRLIAQYDIKNGVTQLINYSIDPVMGVGVPQLFANGADAGIKHSLRVTDDLFAKGDPKIVNHKTYYFLIISYGYNNFKKYDPTDAGSLNGQQKPYIASRKGYDGSEIQSYPGIPHNPTPEAGGTVQNANYGDGVEIVRIEGMGNGGNELDLTDASRLEIARNNRVDELTYAAGKGPIDVKIIDPLNLPSDEYQVKFIKDGSNGLNAATWELKRLSDDSIIVSDRDIVLGNEQLFPDYGFSINIEQYLHLNRAVKTDIAPGAGSLELSTNLIDWSLTYEDPSQAWLLGFPDQDGNTSANWIRSGTQVVDPATPEGDYNDYQGLDDEQQFEGIAGGTFAPFRLLGPQAIDNTPVGGSYAAGAVVNYNGMGLLNSVDVVYTKDKSLWTRCSVLETQDKTTLAEGGVSKLNIRAAASIDKNGKQAGDAGYNYGEGDLVSATGMGWFPGYVIDLETGERLNVVYGEDSWLAGDNGRDMMFNPTSTFYQGLGSVVAGGKHYLYIFRNNSLLTTPPILANDNNATKYYDDGASIYNRLSGTNTLEKLRVWRSCMWVGTPMTIPGRTFLATDAILKVRVETNYERYANKGYIVNKPSSNVGNSKNDWYNLYQFNTASVATGIGVTDTATSALKMINVVPNPYYAYSNYETKRLDSRVKLTNLPEKCTVRIYNVGGSLIRTFTKDDPLTSLDWDLKNINGVPIAGGVYIIHFDVPDVGEKVIKWFGALRPPDLTNF
tara:strand:- start:3127 stop:7287 length:4161 start_codon:yes stop_codon:yes gene_type:complete